MAFAAPPPAADDEAPRGAKARRLKPRAWVELAEAEGGVVEARGGKVRTVSFPHGPWSFVLDAQSNGESASTRLRVRFHARSPMRLRIQRHNVFTRLATRFGLRDLSVPHPAIDRAFLIRADNESVVRSLVLDRGFADALLGLPRGQLQIIPVRRGLRFVPGAGELRWLTSGLNKDVEVLSAALRVMREGADGLTRLGVMREPFPPRA